MGKLILVGVGVLLLLGVVLTWSPPSDDPARLYYESERYQLQIEQDRESAARWAGFWDVVLPLAGVLVLTAGAGLLVAGGWALWARRKPTIYLDALQIPVTRGALESGALAQLPYAILEHRTQAALAAGPQQPHTYSPHLAFNNRQDGAAPSTEAPALPAFTPPAFAALLASGQIGPSAPLLLGYGADGQALHGTWKDLYSSAVCGLSGSGKTVLLRLLCAQSAMQGAKFVILDPHGESGDSQDDQSLAGTLAPLAPAFLCAPASDPRAMLQALHLAHDELQARLKGRSGPPLIVAIDEFTALMGRSDLAGPMAELIEAIAQEGRKRSVFALVSGQQWVASRAGSTSLRDSLASAYVLRSKRQTARLLINTDDARRAETLQPGMALLARNTGEVIDVTIPYTSGTDMAAVGRLLTQDAAPMANTRLTAGEVVAKPRLTVVRPNWWDDLAGPGTNVADLAAPAPPTLTPMQKRALALWRARRPPAEIVTALGFTYTPTTGAHKGQAIPVTSAAGAVYQARLQEILELIWSAEEAERQAVAGGWVPPEGVSI